MTHISHNHLEQLIEIKEKLITVSSEEEYQHLLNEINQITKELTLNIIEQIISIPNNSSTALN